MEKNMHLNIKNKTFNIVLEKSETTSALIKCLPLRITMLELNGNEKYYYLDNALPSNSKYVGEINVGDVMLYGNNCLVVFYESFSTNYSYTKIGHIENTKGLKGALGKGSVEVLWEE